MTERDALRWALPGAEDISLLFVGPSDLRFAPLVESFQTHDRFHLIGDVLTSDEPAGQEVRVGEASFFPTSQIPFWTRICNPGMVAVVLDPEIRMLPRLVRVGIPCVVDERTWRNNDFLEDVKGSQVSVATVPDIGNYNHIYCAVDFLNRTRYIDDLKGLVIPLS